MTIISDAPAFFCASKDFTQVFQGFKKIFDAPQIHVSIENIWQILHGAKMITIKENHM